MPDLSNICVVLPSLDPDEKLLRTIDGLVEYGFSDIILVNDGSKPENLRYFETACALPQVNLLHHKVNRGKGAALKTAFTYVLDNRPDCIGVVTVDGDGQHHSEDTKACALHMAETGRLTLGVRDFSQPDVPFRSKSGNKLTSLAFKVFVGMTITDTQTGLRAIPRKYLSSMLEVSGDRFEYETNMLLYMKRAAIAFDEVKIRTVYIEENKSSHFRPVRDSWRIYKLILAHFFKYGISSVLSAIIDTGLFTLLSLLLRSVLKDPLLTVIPTVSARAVSSLCNFFLNKKLVFKSQGRTGKALLRYYMLAVPQALLQLLLTQGVYMLLGITAEQTLIRGLLYTAVMCVLFVFSFMIQQRWVFQDKE